MNGVVPSTQPENAPPPGDCEFQPAIDGLRLRLRTALEGKDDVIEQVLACLLARGHLLFEDLPGLGKTTLAKELAHVIGGRFARIQCTPDLLPGDVTGFSIFDQKERDFTFLPGPVFADVLLADEINRATPRTQSALFEAMAERQVTVDGECHTLSSTFCVLATQNPLDSHGTYPLPEAQLDRFAMKLRIGYPDPSSEVRMLANDIGVIDRAREPRPPILDPQSLARIQEHVAHVAVGEKVRTYLVELASKTRDHSAILCGLSPRSLKTWQRVAQAWAHLDGRDFVTPDDIRTISTPVLEVRLGLEPDRFREVWDEILDSTPVPV